MSPPPGFLSLPLSVAELSLTAVLKCGQSFRWHAYPLPQPSPSSHEYRFCLRDRVVCLRQTDDTLYYKTVLPERNWSAEERNAMDAETLLWIKDYCQLDVNLVKLYDDWSEKDRIFKSFRSRFVGIRMLRQDPFENLISFICSSNNNIARITKMVNSLCTEFSLPLVTLPDPSDEKTQHAYHPFPPPSALPQDGVASKLRSLGFGYRAEFIQRTAKMLVETHGTDKLAGDPSESAERWLMTLRGMDLDPARQELLKFVGVGRKVADCILLMSLDKRNVIPVDTHVQQIATKHYGMKAPKSSMTAKVYEDISTKLANIWGDYAGWAHTVLFTADLKSFSDYGTETTVKRKLEVAETDTHVVVTELEEERTVKRRRVKRSKS